ncbi:hypothetical protein WJR50_08925 [Catalinimonas sp. 4WD22]|uniref:toxin-antitoxin system YwqK family antitoxin n=1 Tax=Catalinimonas locisalis TaxID=3133978 RepID=UPI0031019216
MMILVVQILIWLSFLFSSTTDNCKGEMVDGARHGHWQCFYGNGKIQEEGDYQSGQKVGHWKFYHENGNIALEGDYKDGHESGAWKMYDEAGNQLDTIDYGR